MRMLATPHVWTADDLDRLPDDGNKYEVVDGRLLVTPAPSLAHEEVLRQLRRLLELYLDRHGLGGVFPRNDLKFDEHNRVDPDLSIVAVFPPIGSRTWRDVPRPMLVVEVLSRSTRTHDLVWKRELYRREGIATCWIVDHRKREVHVVRPGLVDELVTGRLSWAAPGVAEAFELDLPEFFDAVIGARER